MFTSTTNETHDHEPKRYCDRCTWSMIDASERLVIQAFIEKVSER